MYSISSMHLLIFMLNEKDLINGIMEKTIATIRASPFAKNSIYTTTARNMMI